MMGITLLLLLLFLLLIFSPVALKGRGFIPWQFTKRIHFSILTIFLGILLICTVATEMMEPFRTIELPFTKASAEFQEERFDLESALWEDKRVDESFILATNKHPVGDTITIYQDYDEFEGPIVYVRRKPNDDRIVEEIIYKPFLSMNDYDLSEALTVNQPEWTNHTVTFSSISLGNIAIVSYFDAPILNQFTQHPYDGDRGYSSQLRAPVIQLIVPENMNILLPDGEDNILFLDEIE